MLSADEEVLSAAERWLSTGQSVTLITVVRTFGSAPRPPGALMVISNGGAFAGSVSGGCVETDLIERFGRSDVAHGRPQILSYGVRDEDVQRFGLPCGGRLDLLVENFNEEEVSHLLEGIRARRPMARRVRVTDGEVILHTPESMSGDLHREGDELVRVFGPRWRLVIIGAGQVSRFLAQMALALDYEVIVCDPREEYARAWQVDGCTLDTRMPDDVVRDLACDPRSAVVALTHDPKLDDLALLEALNADTFYVGALGSRTNNARRRARLAALGLDAAAVARLHGPVGLALGGRAPAEIAVAVVAELVALRHGVCLEPTGRRWHDGAGNVPLELASEMS